jgi:tripartite ATP-independent transporter DctP family solute receptor
MAWPTVAAIARRRITPLRHNPGSVPQAIGRRTFLAGAGAAAFGAGCRSRLEGGRLILRLSHSMTAGPTALHVLGQTFKEIVERRTNGEVIVRVFASGTLGQERETVQQVQEGLIDFMVSGSAIWGSVAPRLQVFDFPFLWRDWDHVHRVVDGRAGQRAADYLEQTVRMRPLAWGDSFGFRNVVTRGYDITEPARLAGLKIRTIQSAIYVKAVELMGASPTPMAFGEVYTSLQTGVIDGYEHDASTTLQQRFYEVAGFLTCTRHIAGVLGLWSSATTMAQLPADVRAVLAASATEAAAVQRARGPIEDTAATASLRERGMTIREIDARPWHPAAEALWQREARALGAGAWLEDILA